MNFAYFMTMLDLMFHRSLGRTCTNWGGRFYHSTVFTRPGPIRLSSVSNRFAIICARNTSTIKTRSNRTSKIVPSTGKEGLTKLKFVCLFVCLSVTGSKRTLPATIRIMRCVDAVRGKSMRGTRIRGLFPSDDNGC